MILKTEEFKKVCSTVLNAVNVSELNTITTLLELKTEGYNLFLNITDREYYVSVKYKLDHIEDFHIIVNATLFLKLISQITSEDIELECSNNTLSIKANGNYKLPSIDIDGKSFLPIIDIYNKTLEMNIDTSTLLSILNVNSKELLKTDSIAKPIQRLYYIDQQGCITFTSGACVNEFTLDQPVSLLLNDKIVKLFKLLNSDSVKFTLGYDYVSTTLQTKIKLENDDLFITAITPSNDDLLSQVPVKIIRNLSNVTDAASVTLLTKEFSQAVSRLLLFSKKSDLQDSRVVITISNNKVTLADSNNNIETINTLYEGSTYTMTLNLFDLKVILDSCSELSIVLSFNEKGEAVVLSRGSVKNVISKLN